jgi:CRISPR-associated protein Cst1
VLKYTGHPLVDVGLATIAAFVGKDDPSDLIDADLDQVADYIGQHYTCKPLQGFIHGAVFPNSGYTNPGIKGERRGYYGPVLYSYQEEPTEDMGSCVVCGAPSQHRIARDYFPLLTGRDVINFYPWGDSGLPICGRCLLSVQAYPLGSGGLMLVVHSDNDDLIYHFAKEFLEFNRTAIHLAQLAGDKKLLGAKYSYRTLLIDTLLRASHMQCTEKEDERLFSVTAYLLSNSGQKPSLEIYHLPLEMIGFLREMKTADYRDQWNAIVHRAWEVAPQKKGGKKGDEPFQPRRNWLYEDLFKLPDNAQVFLRTYFLREALRYARAEQGDPRGGYSLKDEAGLVSWKVTAKFLRRILHMENERVEQIRTMGDRLADYVSSQNDRRFFREFYTVQRYDHFRTALIKANLAHVKRGNPPIITLDPYIEVFEEGDELAHSDWRLARDLVLIRMVERLYAQGWLGQNVDVIADSTEEETEQA